MAPTKETGNSPDLESTPVVKVPSITGSSTEIDHIGDAPDGGFRAWSVAAAGSATFFCLGLAWTFGVFQQYYSVHQLKGESLDKIAWIGSVASFIQFAAGAIAGPLFDRYGSAITRPAAVGLVAALMLLSICREYWHFILVQGILVGVCSSMLQLPAFAATSQYFDKHRAAALGVVVAGSSIGGVVFPVAVSKMLNDSSLGFGWSIRILGFVMIPLVAISCFGLKPRLPPTKSRFFLFSAFRDPKYIFLIAGLSFMFLGMNTPIYFIPTYAVSKGVDPALASYFVAIINGASTFGRVIPGIMADKIGRFNTFAVGGFSTGVVILCLYQVETTAAFIVYCVVFGFCSGSIISGGAAALTVCCDDPRDFGSYMGMGCAVAAVSVLIGPPINGALVDRYGGFFELSIFSGVVSMVGGLIALLSKRSMPGGMLGLS